MLNEIISWIVQTVSDLGYIGIFVMMLLESSFFPFPSEVAMIPAGYLASKGEMNIYLVVIAGILGSLAGAVFNYWLALRFGRVFVLKFGKFFFFKEETLVKMEDYFSKHGEISTFVGRLVPVVRQYISLPAGLSKMDLAKFSFYTSLGAGIWVIILALLGYFIGDNELLVKEYLHSIIIGVLVVLLCIVFIYVRKMKKETL
ncbi:MAG: DedA family protein [Arcobacteraceae bacterium]|jgi:membrane protein DedA with SNARE-associated domain|nr:DedA family protein [Arcobacteraceae bacterium]